jgi:hypothetical protein
MLSFSELWDTKCSDVEQMSGKSLASSSLSLSTTCRWACNVANHCSRKDLIMIGHPRLCHFLTMGLKLSHF